MAPLALVAAAHWFMPRRWRCVASAALVDVAPWLVVDVAAARCGG